MGIVIDLKNAIRDAIYAKDNTIHFNFNKMQTVSYPYAFLYFVDFKMQKCINKDYWQKLDFNCVLEYMLEEDNSQTQLWEKQETLLSAISTFTFLNTKLNALNIAFKTIDDVLQMTFELTVYAKEVDTGDLMRELDFSYKEII